jgi:hypothetical protein
MTLQKPVIATVAHDVSDTTAAVSCRDGVNYEVGNLREISELDPNFVPYNLVVFSSMHDDDTEQTHARTENCICTARGAGSGARGPDSATTRADPLRQCNEHDAMFENVKNQIREEGA